MPLLKPSHGFYEQNLKNSELASCPHQALEVYPAGKGSSTCGRVKPEGLAQSRPPVGEPRCFRHRAFSSSIAGGAT
jgi:hypothetical protein